MKPVRPPMNEMPIATCPRQIVETNLMGPPFESSLYQCHYLWLMIDHYSGWIEAYPLKNKSSWFNLQLQYNALFSTSCTGLIIIQQ